MKSRDFAGGMFDKGLRKADNLADCPKQRLSRSEKTRKAIRSAFTRLVFSRGYDNVAVPDIVAEVGIARSTFYEHFGSREDVLRAAMTPIFGTIADCVCGDEPPGRLNADLDHLWSNRRLSDAIFSGQARNILVRNQVDLVESRLRHLQVAKTSLLPLRLAATNIAEGQLALVESWLRGRAFCPVEQLAAGIHRISRTSALALIAAA